MSYKPQKHHQPDSPEDSGGSVDIVQAYLQYRPALSRLLSRFFKRPQDIEDVMQETFVRVLEAESKNNINSPCAYLFKTARNLAIKEITKSSNRLTDYVGAFLPQEVLITDSSVEDQIEAREMLSLFYQAVKGLPDQCRKVYILRKVYGFSHKEIAANLSISVNTVERHIAKGILRCTEHMETFGYSTRMFQPAIAVQKEHK